MRTDQEIDREVLRVLCRELLNSEERRLYRVLLYRHQLANDDDVPPKKRAELQADLERAEHEVFLLAAHDRGQLPAELSGDDRYRLESMLRDRERQDGEGT